MTTHVDPDSSVRQAESILDNLAATALDDDYYAPHVRSGGRGSTIAVAAVLACFTLLLTVAAVQTRTDRPATQAERTALIEQIRIRQDLVDSRRATVSSLQVQIADLETSAAIEGPATRALRISTGAVAVTGPGLKISVSSAEDDERDFGRVTDTDVQLVVNGLWMSGAEAVAVDGNRLTSTSAIRWAGDAITVNYRSVTEPITIWAVGDADRLLDQWTAGPSGRYLRERAKDDGLSYTVRGSDRVDLPAAPESRLSVSAEPLRSGS